METQTVRSRHQDYESDRQGKKNNKTIKYTWDLFDKYDTVTAVHSMARTTGYTATVAVRMIADGVYTRKGVSMPESIGKDPGCMNYMLEGLKGRGVICKETIGEVK